MRKLFVALCCWDLCDESITMVLDGIFLSCQKYVAFISVKRWNKCNCFQWMTAFVIKIETLQTLIIYFCRSHHFQFVLHRYQIFHSNSREMKYEVKNRPLWLILFSCSESQWWLVGFCRSSPFHRINYTFTDIVSQNIIVLQCCISKPI